MTAAKVDGGESRDIVPLWEREEGELGIGRDGERKEKGKSEERQREIRFRKPHEVLLDAVLLDLGLLIIEHVGAIPLEESEKGQRAKGEVANVVAHVASGVPRVRMHFMDAMDDLGSGRDHQRSRKSSGADSIYMSSISGVLEL